MCNVASSAASSRQPGPFEQSSWSSMTSLLSPTFHFAGQLTGSASVPSHVLDLASAATPPGSKPGDRPPRDAHSVLAIDVLASHRSLGGRGSETPGVAPSLSHFTPVSIARAAAFDRDCVKKF